MTTTLLGLLLLSTAQATVLQVPSDHADVVTAVAAARPGDVIEIQPGVYPTTGLMVPPGVTLRGLGASAADVVLDGENRGRILTARHLTAPVTIQNLTFRRGSATGESANLRSGGALFIINSEVVVQNCNFTANEADAHGGAIRCVDSPARFSQCVFTDNVAVKGGGAIDVSYGSSPRFYQCAFSGNRAAWGGALSNRGGAEPEFTGCRFVDNVATAELGFGGGAYADFTAAPRFLGCTFQGNRARYGGAIGAFQGSGISIEHCTLVANDSAVEGAGVFSIGSAPRLISSLVVDNSGAGLAARDSSEPLVACAGFHGNTGGPYQGTLDGESAGIYDADPAFCSRDDDMGTRYHLTAESPYADAICGVLGAWTPGCESGDPLITGFETARSGSRLVVRWRADEDPYNQWFRLTWTSNEVEREVVFAQGRDDGYTGVQELPSGTKADIRIRLYSKTENEEWALLQDTGGDLVPEIPAMTGIPVRAWPNPFNPQTNVAFELPRRQRVRVTIHDLHGQLVRILLDATLPEGSHEEPWNGRDRAGRVVSAGVYMVRVQGENANSQVKITLLK
ncbi:MAG: T9SS type A sorting domain-containing protein [bacterium]|nr:T9SS type A sorting domain-containing protein [bacterium]